MITLFDNEDSINFLYDLFRMLKIAEQYHRGQMYDDKSYMYHILEVTRRALGTCNTEVILAAPLHDLLEDTECTSEMLHEIIDDSIVDIVEIVTRKKDETYWEYIDRVKESSNKNAILLKCIDLLTNKTYSKKTGNSLEKRYTKALSILYNKGR